MPIWEISGIVLATLAAGFIKGAAGMGAGIFLQPTLTLLTNPMLALGISGPILLFTDAGSLCAYWKKWASFRIIWPLFLGCFLGTILGLVLLPFIAPLYLKLIVGICGLAFVLTKIVKREEKKSTLPPSPTSLVFMTACGGFFNTVANAGGIFFAWCCIRLRLNPAMFVATLVIVILFNSVFKVSGYLMIDTLTFQQLLFCFLLLPVAVGGAWLGSRFNKRLKNSSFNILILSIILVISILNLVSFGRSF